MKYAVNLSSPRWALRDLIFAVFVVIIGALAASKWSTYMDIYEKSILLATIPALAWLAWYWRALQIFIPCVLAFSALGIYAYGGQMDAQETQFVLKFFLSSQSAIILMSLAAVASFFAYWLSYIPRLKTLESVGTILLWITAFFAALGMGMRWYESYLVLGEHGHVPVSNLYEVMILFILLATLYYLYYEQKFRTKGVGAFIGFINIGAVAFIVWYAVERNGHDIQPLVPALKSWWMKLHVPANFIGYGTFAIAAMTGFAYLVKTAGEKMSKVQSAILLLLGLLVMASLILVRGASVSSQFWIIFLGVNIILIGCIVLLRQKIAGLLPEKELLEEMMYRCVAVGFAFFTVATVLGAAWADEAWGAAWSWDPKEIWALIVWLFYAAWLHQRLMGGAQGKVLAILAVVGIFITAFAFWGVNMFLSGLHSYGSI